MTTAKSDLKKESVMKTPDDITRHKLRTTKADKKCTYAEVPAIHREFVEKTFACGIERLKLNFKAMKNFKPANASTNAFQANPTRNRFKDILCLDATRVPIKREEKDGYIHANFVTGGNGRKFIATQGPTEPTVVDFWHMLWQEDVSAILMLCQVMELKKKKCEQYWPLKTGDKKTFGAMTVTKKSEELRYLANDQRLTCSELEVVCKGTTRVIKHLQWPDWPDNSVPRDTIQVIKIRKHLMEAVRDTNVGVIHCSAGIGRTGTLTVLDKAMCIIENKSDKLLNVEEILRQVRSERLHAVQTEIQWLFIHMCLVDYILRRQKVDPVTVPGYEEFHDHFLAHQRKEPSASNTL